MFLWHAKQNLRYFSPILIFVRAVIVQDKEKWKRRHFNQEPHIGQRAPPNCSRGAKMGIVPHPFPKPEYVCTPAYEVKPPSACFSSNPLAKILLLSKGAQWNAFDFHSNARKKSSFEFQLVNYSIDFYKIWRILHSLLYASFVEFMKSLIFKQLHQM